MEKFILNRYIENHETGELDIDNIEQALGEYPNDGYDTIVIGDTSRWGGDCDPMNIDKLIKILGDLKSKGCTHVELMFHCDHHSYVINGLELREATKEEVDQYLKEKEEHYIKIRNRKIQELEKELDNLKKSKNNS